MPTYITLKCLHCQKNFQRSAKDIASTKHNIERTFCTQECKYIFHRTKKIVKCLSCSKDFLKKPFEIKKCPNNFCCRSCAATYNNTHKIKGTRVSKLELYCQEQLTKLYPYIQIDFNEKSAINSELDIYIPSLSLAFELNGILHYNPIYGTEKLQQIQNNDNKKIKECKEKQINLVIIDTRKQNYFKEKTSKEYLKIITETINQSGGR